MLRRLLSLAALPIVLGHASPTPADGKNGKSPAPVASAGPQWTNATQASGAECLAKLKLTGAKFVAHPPSKGPNKQGCGMPQGVTVTKGPTGIVWSPPLEIDCALAVELPAIEKVLQEEAKEHLGEELRRVDTLGAYACRTSKGPLTNAYAKKPVLSEHAFGLAIDLKAFVPKKGAPVRVLADWGKSTPRGAFLAELRSRLRNETAITHVITPDYNAAHRDHLHVDRGLPWGWWF